MTEGMGAFYANETRRNDGGAGTYPRYSLIYSERATSPSGAPNDEDTIFGIMSATTVSETNAKFIAGVLSGTLQSDEWTTDLVDLSAGIVVKTDRVTVKPGIVLDPTTEAAAPDTKGSMMYDSGTDELKYWDGSWQVVSAGGLSSHALDGAYHTATGLTVGWVLSADSPTTFSWKAPTGGTDPDAIHDNAANEITAITPKTTLGSTDEFVLEDGGASFVKKAVTFANIESSISLANLGTRTHASLSDAPADAHHVAFVLADFTTAFAAESLANLTTRAHSDLSDTPTDAHHSESHVLSGSTHTATSLTVGWVISADSATTFSWKAPTGGMTAHDLTGALHTEDATGGSGNVIVADSGTTFSWQQLDYSELANIPSSFTPSAHVLATSGPHSGELPFADLAAGTQGSIIRRGASDWEEYALGTETYVLKAGAIDVSWGTVDYSELSGSQPAPINHNLIDTTGHPVSGLTGGHFLKALTTTTYGFAAHGLTASDVGAAATLSGTQWTLPVFDTTTTIGDSIASQDASATYLEVDGAIVTATGQWVAATGAPDGYIWAVSGDYPTYGIYYNSGTPDFLEFHWAAAIKTKFNMEDGAFECAAGNFNVDASGNITDITVAAASTDTDKFLVLDTAQIKFRTGAEVASDIGAATVPLALTDLASYVQGSIIIGGGADWEALAAGTEDYVLKMGVAEPTWGQVDWSELSGTQPAPVAHNLIDTTGHPVSSLNDGHFLKATGTTTYAFEAHGLGASDVGAYTTAQVDSAIDTDISTHADLPNAHHPQSHDLSSHSDTSLLQDPEVDRIVFWDDSDSEYEWLVANTGLSITDNNLNCDITQYTDTMVENVIDTELGDGYSIDAAIDGLILTHKNLAAAHHAKWTTGDTEGVITAELIDGQSIDNAIDSLIDDHAGLTDAHHAQSHSMDSHPNTSLSDPGATKLVYWDDGANLFNFLNAGTGLTISGVNLNCDITQYTDTMTEAVITAELVNGQSIDLAIDALILTHKNDNDAHHALVTVTALPLTLSGQAVTFNYNTNHFKLTGNNLEIGTDTPGTDEVLKWSGSAAVWSTPAGGTDYDADLVIGSGNATWINCPYEGASAVAHDDMDAYGRVTPGISAAVYYNYSVPLPTNRGGKKLYISGTRVSLSDADSANMVTNTYIRAHAATTSTNLDTDPTDKKTVALHEDLSMGALDCGAYHKIALTLHCTADDALALDIQFITVRYYYA